MVVEAHKSLSASSRVFGNPFQRPPLNEDGLDDPGPDISKGLFVVIAFFVVFLGWASLVRVWLR